MFELLINKLWYRGKPEITKLLWKDTSETPTPFPFPIARLPQKLVEMIIACLAHDKPSLLARSMTCYLWYIATVPHLHHTLTADELTFCLWDEEYQWLKRLQKSYNSGTLPFVKRFRIRLTGFPSKLFMRPKGSRRQDKVLGNWPMSTIRSG